MSVTHSAGSIHDLAEGAMLEREVAGRPVLLCRAAGEYHALGAHCTHYGAPLADGALYGTCVVCPWHHAMFDVATGARLAAPALDPIARYPVEVRGDELWVTLPEDDETSLPPSTRQPPAPADDRTFVIVGAGAAGEAAAEELRAMGFAGRLVLITAEDALPYDRPQLSKGYAAGQAGDDDLPLRDAAFFESRGIELLTGRRVTRLDAGARTVTFENGQTLRYDAALAAPGARPRALDVPGAAAAAGSSPGVRTLRSDVDARRIAAEAATSKGVVLIGSGFIGMELAASLRGRGLEVDVVTRDDEPFQRALGPIVGRFFREVHERNGVRFHRNATVESVERGSVAGPSGGAAGAVVVLSDGTRVEGDMVVAGVGVAPATDFVEGVEKDVDGAIVVDAELRAAPGLWAAGDVALYPDARLGRRVRVEHWRLAQQHGRRAARNMVGAAAPFGEAPFFWSEQFDAGLTYVGNAADTSDAHIDGSLADGSFIAYYLEGEHVAAAAGVGRDREMAAFQALADAGTLPTAEEVREGVDLLAWLGGRVVESSRQ